MKIKSFLILSFVLLQSCMVENSPNASPNTVENFRESSSPQIECSDSVYNGSYTSNRGYLYICDNYVRLNDTSYNVKISKDIFNPGQLTVILDDPNLITPLNRFKYPYSSSILVENDTLYMIQTQNKTNWIKWVKYGK